MTGVERVIEADAEDVDTGDARGTSLVGHHPRQRVEAPAEGLVVRPDTVDVPTHVVGAVTALDDHVHAGRIGGRPRVGVDEAAQDSHDDPPRWMTSPVSTTSRPVPPGGARSSKIVSLPSRGPSAPNPVKLTSTVHDAPDASVTPHVPGIQPKPALVLPVIVVWETVSGEGPLFVMVTVCGGDGTPSFGRRESRWLKG